MLEKENLTKKVDDVGRIVIPKSLRSKFQIAAGDELEYFTFAQDGRKYIALAKPMEDVERYAAAARVLEELGLDVPDVLNELLE